MHTRRFSIRGLTVNVMLALLAATTAALWAACTLAETPGGALPVESPTGTAEPAAIASPAPAPTAPPAATPAPTSTPIPTPAPTATSVPTPPPTATPEPPPGPLSAFTNGPWLEAEAPELASAISGLAWVEDGLDDIETQAIEDLLYMAVESLPLAASVVSLAWVQDGVVEAERDALKWIQNIGETEVAASVVAMAWVQDSVDDLEVSALEQISYVSNDHPSVAPTVIALTWVQDGVDEREVTTIKWLSFFADEKPAVIASFLALGWMRDGIEEMELEAVRWIAQFKDSDTAATVVALPWLQDAVTDPEPEAIQYLSRLADHAPAATRRIMVMPFMDEVTPLDVFAIRSLWELSTDYPDIFDRLAASPLLRLDISDGFVPVLVTLAGVAGTNPDLILPLLNPFGTSREHRIITTPMAGKVELVIIRTKAGAARSMDLLEHAVVTSEEFMGAPFPAQAVVLLFEEAVSPNAAGTNFGTHFAIRPKYDVDDGGFEAATAPHIMAHEVAHYYWSDNADWVDEGAADFMGSTTEEHRTGQPVATTNYPCPFLRTIAELDELETESGDPEFTCNYALGERLFVDLYHTLGEERFRKGFLDLYLASQVEDGTDELEGTRANIQHVMEAFGAGDALVDAVIGRWYDGSTPYDLSRLDTNPVDPSLPSFNGRVEASTVSIGVNAAPQTEFSAAAIGGGVLLSLKVSYQVYSALETLNVEVAEYYEDGFQISRHVRPITAEAVYIGATYYFSVGPPSGEWATGRYYVYLYADGHKIAQVEYTVVP